METLTKTVNIIAIVIGLYSILASVDPVYGSDPYAILGGIMFAFIGGINLIGNSYEK